MIGALEWVAGVTSQTKTTPRRQAMWWEEMMMMRRTTIHCLSLPDHGCKGTVTGMTMLQDARQTSKVAVALKMIGEFTTYLLLLSIARYIVKFAQNAVPKMGDNY